MTRRNAQSGLNVVTWVCVVSLPVWTHLTRTLPHAEAAPAAQAEVAQSRPADDRMEPPEPQDTAGFWAQATHEDSRPAAATRPAGLQWDVLSAQVIPEVLSHTGEAVILTQLAQASCRIDIATRSDLAPPFQGALRYAWHDVNDDGLLTRNEVQVRAVQPASQETPAQLEQLRASFEAQALGNLWNTFLLNKVATTRNDGGYRVTIQPEAGDALESLGITEIQVELAGDFCTRNMRVRTAQGAQSVSEVRNEKLDGRWFTAGYVRRTTLPNGVITFEEATVEHAVTDGVPLTRRITIRTRAELAPGQTPVNLQQEFTFSDWKVVRRAKPLTATQIIALRLLQPAGRADQPPPAHPRETTDPAAAWSGTRRTPSSMASGIDSQAAPGRNTPAPPASQDRPRLRVAAIEKYVSPQAHFVAYKPKDWVVREETRLGYLIITVADPTERYQAQVITGLNSFGSDLAGIIRAATGRIRERVSDYRFAAAMRTADGKKLVCDTAYTDPSRGKRSGRCWVSAEADSFIFANCDAPAGEFLPARDVLLTILSNIRICRNTIPTGSKVPPLTGYRLSDGSASFSIPQGWRVQEIGRGQFLASDPEGAYGFLVAKADVITPELGVSVPGVPVSRYLPPSRALPFLCEAQGIASGFRIEQLIPRPDMAQAVGRVYTVGQVTVEEFVFTCDGRTGRTKGYTFGFSFGTRLNTNWSLQHLTVSAPVDRFEAFAATFAAMLQSYTIDDEFARRYVAEGMARVRQMQQDTARIIAKNASDIRNMMQAAYDERQRSQDYIDYLRTGYIRGETDWISNMEGGTVYHSDSWGTRNTATGEYYEGQPYNYVNFRGANPRYNEQMIEINNRQLYDQVFARSR